MSEHDPNPLHAQEYTVLRARVREFVAAADPAALDAVAPATPQWRVRDVLAHMVGVVDDVSNQRLDGVTTDPWTAAQVEKRRDCSVEEVLDEWDALAPEFEAGLAALPASITGQALFDAVTHEHDMRHALGMPGGRDAPAVTMVFDWYTTARSAGGAPAIRFDTGERVVVAGAGDAAVTVRAPTFELIRALCGRRSVSEIERYGWDPACDPSLLLPDNTLFRFRDEPLNE